MAETAPLSMDDYDSEELARALFEEAGDALFLFDPDTDKLLDVNPMAQRLSGLGRRDLLEMPTTYLFRFEGENKAGMSRLRQASRKSGIFHSQEGFFMRTNRDGVWIPVNLTIARLHMKPKTLGLITVRDLREQREAHAELKKMEAELRRVMASVSDCLWSAEVDPKGQWTYRYFSPVVEKITGRLPAHFLESVRRWWDTVHPDDREKWQKSLGRLKSGQATHEEYRVVWPDGSIHWVRDSVLVSKAADGRSLRLDGVLTDITEHKLAEAALQASEERYRELFENANDAIYTHDLQGNFTSANKAVEHLTGYSRDELLKLNISHLVEPSQLELAREMIQRKLAGEPSTTYNIDIKIKNGETLTLEVSTRIIYKHGAPVGVEGICRDITERKRAQEALQRTATDLSHSNRELEEFAYVISHDLQEPLRMIASYLQLLSRRYQGKLDKDADEFINYAVDGATRMRTLINDLLAYSRVGTRGKDIKAVDCNDVLEGVLANLSTAIRESEAGVTHGKLPTVMADATQLAQVFQNLVGNAIKFRGQEAPKVHVDTACEESFWHFTVQDNGIGIDPENAHTIFVIFQRLHGRDEYPGTGIGLSICKKIIESLEGRIWVESTPGEGSIFHFTLPQRAVS